MKPVSDFTTPRRLIAPISRHFFPVEQPEPFVCTTGLKNGSRFPFIAHFFSSGLGALGAVAVWVAAAGALSAGAVVFAGAEAFAVTGAAALPDCFDSGFEACAAGFAAACDWVAGAEAFTGAALAGAEVFF